ncbi:class II glutamine amidotransferase [Engelhardtia mirabilis]|uniref:class II glutamine amidotransferase n=1 Tax=Engelhardtia mirabilis TaxID=2528011 RepID=UPI003AF35A28
MGAHVGVRVPLSSLLYDPEHSLEVQAYRPREMCSGHVNVDGTGVAWWPRRGAGEPLRYVTERPPWSDPNLPALAPRIEAEVILAAVRSATPGMPFSAAAVAPFVADGVAFAHNGFVEDFERAVARSVLARLPDDLFGELQVRTDSLVLFALLRRHLRERPAAGLAEAHAAATAELAEICVAAGVRANLVSVAVDGGSLSAIRSAVGLPPNSLYIRADKEAESAQIASEPLQGSIPDPGSTKSPPASWEPVPDQTQVRMCVDRPAESLRSVALEVGAPSPPAE